MLGVPVESQALSGLDSLLSIVQMPAGIPVGTLAIGQAGAVNAALLAAAILGAARRAGARRSSASARRRPTRCSHGPIRARLSVSRLRVGILGGGQLGRMLALAGHPLGLVVRFLDPAAEALRGRRSAQLIVGAYDDPEALARLADGADVVTYEFENVPVAALARAARPRARVSGRREALEVSQDRLVEKQLFARLGAPCAPFAQSTRPAELDARRAARACRRS